MMLGHVWNYSSFSLLDRHFLPPLQLTAICDIILPVKTTKNNVTKTKGDNEMGKFFYGVATASATLLGVSPLLLIIGLVSHDTSRFVHCWFVFCLTMLITYFVSIVLAQLLD